MELLDALGGGDNPMKSMLFQALMASLAGGGKQRLADDDFNVLGPLSPEDKKEWSEIEKAHKILHSRVTAMNAEIEGLFARRKLFWAKLEESTGIYDKNMRINDNHELMVEKDEPKDDTSPERRELPPSGE